MHLYFGYICGNTCTIQRIVVEFHRRPYKAILYGLVIYTTLGSPVQE